MIYDTIWQTIATKFRLFIDSSVTDALEFLRMLALFSICKSCSSFRALRKFYFRKFIKSKNKVLFCWHVAFCRLISNCLSKHLTVKVSKKQQPENWNQSVTVNIEPTPFNFSVSAKSDGRISRKGGNDEGSLNFTHKNHRNDFVSQPLFSIHCAHNSPLPKHAKTSTTRWESFASFNFHL